MSIQFVLGVLNSSVLNWRFDLTSTNNNVGTNELEALPFPIIKERPLVEEIEKLVDTLTAMDLRRSRDVTMTKEYKQLDVLVHKAFDLTPSEIEIIASRKP